MTTNMKMADLINSAPCLLSVADRLSIRFGFGEASVEECCKRDGKDPFTFLSICRTALSEDYLPSETELCRIRVADVTAFLKNSHDSYQNSWLPGMEKAIGETLVGRPEAQQKVISEFFRKFKNELGVHFELEEKKIFPSLEAIGKGKGSIRVFQHEHGEIEEKIQDLINLLLKYLVYEKQDPKVTWLLSFLYAFKEDLIIHSRIEDRLILPLIGGKANE